MGAALCKLFKQRPVNVLFFGLNASGKTTLLYRLKLGKVVTTLPTIHGDIIETLEINDVNMIAWEVGLRFRSRPMLLHYMKEMDTVVFMVDSSNRERLTAAVDDFFSFVNDEIQEKRLPVLVLANKQDSSEVMSPEEIKKAIYEKGGTAFQTNTALEVFPIVALTLEGVTPALEWLRSQLALKMANNSYLDVWSWMTRTYKAFTLQPAKG